MRLALDSRTNVQRKDSLADVFEVSKLLTFAACKNVTISVWRSTPTANALTRIDGYLAKHVKTNARFASVIVMETANFGAPDHAARAEHGRLTKKYEDRSFGVAMLVEGNTAKHSVYRFVLTTMQLLSSPVVPQKIFQTSGAAAGWIASYEPELDKLELIEGIKEARALVP